MVRRPRHLSQGFRRRAARARHGSIPLLRRRRLRDRRLPQRPVHGHARVGLLPLRRPRHRRPRRARTASSSSSTTLCARTASPRPSSTGINDGGIINPVRLVFVPRAFIENFRVSTRLEGPDAVISVDVHLASRDERAAEERSPSAYPTSASSRRAPRLRLRSLYSSSSASRKTAYRSGPRRTPGSTSVAALDPLRNYLRRSRPARNPRRRPPHPPQRRARPPLRHLRPQRASRHRPHSDRRKASTATSGPPRTSASTSSAAPTTPTAKPGAAHSTRRGSCGGKRSPPIG